MIESLVAKQTLNGHELFMFTDNSTAESAFFKGTSSSEKLFDLVLRLRKIEMEGNLFIHFVHVAGTRMISSGVDGLSRGDHNAGAMAGESMLSFVPLSQNASERSAALLPWVRSWAEAKDKNKQVKVLSPTEWCDPHPSGETYVWVPPPAAAGAAIDWLGQSIHQRPESVHIVLVPRLMTGLWRKKLSKTSDLLFTVPLESKVLWPKCHFRNIQGRDPQHGNRKDALFERCIRRASLDAFWSLEENTVKGTRSSMRAAIQKAEMIGGDGIFPALGPLPIRDVDGVGAGSIQLLKTLDPGITEPLVQFTTAAKISTSYQRRSTALGALWEASVHSKGETVMVREMTKSYVTSNPVKSQWYERFLKGMHKRMGDSVKQDEAISIEQMTALMEVFATDWRKVVGDPRRSHAQVREVLFPALFSVLAYCGALRGEEVPLMDLDATKEFTASGLEHTKQELKHGVIALHGRFKNEIGVKCHLMPVVRRTNSGLEPTKWIQRMIDWHAETGVDRGPVFRKSNGMRARQSQFSFSILNRLVRVSEEQAGLFPDKNVNILTDYSTRRSFRRGATSRAEIVGLSDTVTNLNNRWRSVEEKAKGKRINHSSMRSYYSGIRLMLEPLLNTGKRQLTGRSEEPCTHSLAGLVHK
jgi:hypothetical protein